MLDALAPKNKKCHKSRYPYFVKCVNIPITPNINIIMPKNKLESILKFNPRIIKQIPYTNIVKAKQIPRYENLSFGTAKSRIKQIMATATVVI